MNDDVDWDTMVKRVEALFEEVENALGDHSTILAPLDGQEELALLILRAVNANRRLLEAIRLHQRRRS